MTRRSPRFLAGSLLGVLSLISLAGAGEKDEQAGKFASPEQFLVDKETDLVAIVRVRSTDYRWVVLSDGDPLPLVVAECEMEESLSGPKAWGQGAIQSVVQLDYTDLVFAPIAPPVIDGRRYLLWATTTQKESGIPDMAPWTAHPQGFLQLRGKGDEFVYWSGRNYLVSAIREAVASGRRLPLDQIVDPVRRLKVAKARVEHGDLGEEKAFIQGLLVNVLDPEGQAKKVDPAPTGATSTDRFGMDEGEAQPHALWYTSLALLRDLGGVAQRRASVVAALAPLARTARPAVRLAVALALVDLGSDAGRDALIHGFESESGAISSDPPDRMTFPGRYPYDDSSITACAHALARLGDRRGLAHPKVAVRLVAAEALKDRPDPELRKMLQDLSAELQPEVDRLRSSGELAKKRRPGDHTERYPTDWVRTQGLLARMGDDSALRRLVEALLEDAATYPTEDAPLVPRGRVTHWSDGPSPAGAIRAASDRPAEVLDRLRGLLEQDARWNSPAVQALRASLETAPPGGAKEPGKRKPTEAEIATLLGDADPERRAEGLAAAGFHQMEAFRSKVLDAALKGKGVERTAAVYALGFFGGELPEATLRQLMVADDLEVRVAAVELATRKGASRFATEAMALVRARVGLAAKAGPDDWATKRGLVTLPRTLARLARGPIPAAMLEGLKDPNPMVRWIVLEALELSGNPDAVRFVEPLTGDDQPALREAARAALQTLGPADR